MGLTTFMTGNFLGVRVWIWFYLGLSMVLFGGVALYWHREKLKYLYYRVIFPEKLLKVVMHYPSGLYKIYWRIIPTDFLFTLENKKYVYDNKAILRHNEIFVDTTKKYNNIKIGKKKYDFNPKLLIKSKGSRYPEIHYFFNIPNPINYDEKVTSGEITISSQNLKTILENDLLQKLLTLKSEKNIMFIIMMLAIANVIGTAFIILNDMGVFAGKGSP